jgi:microcystin degradation protein MlrC
MKVVLAQFIFESNTFNPVAAELPVFTHGGTWLTGAPAVRHWCSQTDSQLTGSLAVLEAAGCETHPVWVAMCGTPAGRLSKECFAIIRQTLREQLRAALPADAFLLHLHGAACAVGEDDVEGNLLKMVRAELGFTGRLVISLDLHGNVTPQMLAAVDALTAYRTMPHIDLRATGERAAGLVLDQQSTVRTLAKIPAIIPPTATSHMGGGFASILQGARQAESQPGIMDVSVFPVQPWLDVAELGTSVVVTSTREAAPQAAITATNLARSWFEQRIHWTAGLRTWPEILAVLREPGPRPWILVDATDATTGGSDGTSADAIEMLWPHRHELAGDVLLWVVDPSACVEASRGKRHFRLGAQGFAVTAEVAFVGEGRYRPRGRAYTGQEFSMGQTAVLVADRLRIVVSSGGALGADPAFYECVGLRPDAALAVQVKSQMGWMAGYGLPQERGLIFDGRGHTSLNLKRLPFTGERRLLHPLHSSPPGSLSIWQSI